MNTKSVLTPDEIELARHALGLSCRNKVSYRNHFVTDPEGADGKVWEAMVARGDAYSRPGSELTGGDTLYWLSPAAARAVLRRGEKLCPEDFPKG